MDEGLKIILSGTLRMLRNIPEHQRTWETIMAAVRQNSLLETTPPDEVTRVDSLIKEGQNTFKCDGSPDPAIVKEVSYKGTSLVANAKYNLWSEKIGRSLVRQTYFRS